jgi:hypothetical protein
VFGWDHVQMRPEDSLLSRLSERDRRDSEITPGTPVGSFLLLYQFPGEALSETRNATVHGYVCTALAPTASGYRLYWGIYVIPVSLAHATVSDRDRAVSTHPVPGYASPDSARVAPQEMVPPPGEPTLVVERPACGMLYRHEEADWRGDRWNKRQHAGELGELVNWLQRRSC